MVGEFVRRLVAGLTDPCAEGVPQTGLISMTPVASVSERCAATAWRDVQGELDAGRAVDRGVVTVCPTCGCPQSAIDRQN